MTEELREHYAEKDRDYWSDDGRRTVVTLEDAMEYAERFDNANFFEFLRNHISDAEELLVEYIADNERFITEYIEEGVW